MKCFAPLLRYHVKCKIVLYYFRSKSEHVQIAQFADHITVIWKKALLLIVSSPTRLRGGEGTLDFEVLRHLAEESGIT